MYHRITQEQVEEAYRSLSEYVMVTPSVTNTQMRGWLEKRHNIPANSVMADDIISDVRQFCKSMRVAA